MRESACCLMIGLGPSLYFRARNQMSSEHPVKDIILFRYINIMSPCVTGENGYAMYCPKNTVGGHFNVDRRIFL